MGSYTQWLRENRPDILAIRERRRLDRRIARMAWYDHALWFLLFVAIAAWTIANLAAVLTQPVCN